MLLSLTHKFIFVANLKAASTSIEKALAPHSDIALVRSEWGKHMTLAQIEQRFDFLLKSQDLSTFTIFGVIRNPVEWVVSLYRSHTSPVFRDRPDLYTGQCSFQEFYETWRARHTSQAMPQASRFWGRSARINFLISFDDVERRFEELTRKLGLVNAHLPRLNVSPEHADRPNIPPELMNRIERDYAEDYALYAESRLAIKPSVSA